MKSRQSDASPKTSPTSPVTSTFESTLTSPKSTVRGPIDTKIVIPRSIIINHKANTPYHTRSSWQPKPTSRIQNSFNIKLHNKY